MSEQTQKVCPDGSMPQVPKEPEVPKITRMEKTYKPKDPRRVEAGKRLAAISKSAKEKKARDRADRKRSPTDREDREDREPGDQPQRGFGPSPPLLDWTIPVGGLIAAGLVALYYKYNKSKQPADTKTEKTEAPKDETRPSEARQRRAPALDSFDD